MHASNPSSLAWVQEDNCNWGGEGESPLGTEHTSCIREVA